MTPISSTSEPTTSKGDIVTSDKELSIEGFLDCLAQAGPITSVHVISETLSTYTAVLTF